jgi:hypothetical protein
MIKKVILFTDLYEDLIQKTYIGYRDLYELIKSARSTINKSEYSEYSHIALWREIIAAFLSHRAREFYSVHYRDEVIEKINIVKEKWLMSDIPDKWLLSLLILRWFFEGGAKVLSENSSSINHQSKDALKSDLALINNLWSCSRDVKQLLVKFSDDLDDVYKYMKIENKGLEEFRCSYLDDKTLVDTLAVLLKHGFLSIQDDYSLIRDVMAKKTIQLVEDTLRNGTK